MKEESLEWGEGVGTKRWEDNVSCLRMPHEALGLSTDREYVSQTFGGVEWKTNRTEDRVSL